MSGGAPLAERLDSWDPRIRDVVVFGAITIGFVAIDRATRSMAQMSDAGEARAFLTAAAIREHLPLAVAGIVVAVAASIRWRRLFSPWHDIDHGLALRWFVLPIVLLLTWANSTYAYNFLADRWHPADRAAVMLLALLAWRFPIALVPFVLQVRIVTHQFDHAFLTLAGQNIDELLVMALVVVVTVVIGAVVIGIDDTSWIPLLLMALVASHFFLPGRSKLPLGWFGADDLSHFPTSAATAGWRGAGDGTWARRTSDLASALSWPLRIGALILELGAVVAVTRIRLFRLWVPGWVLFHLTVLVFTGFWFGSWIAVEVGLLLLLVLPATRSWAATHANVATAAVSVLLVVAGAHVFQPPRLAWLDGPVSYGLEVSVTGDSGTVYRVPAGGFAPFDQEIAFVRPSLAGTREAAAAYGAIATRVEYDALQAIDSFDELAEYERALGPAFAAPDSTSERFFTSWVDHANRRDIDPWFLVGPLPHFRTSAPDPVYDGQEGLTELVVTRVTVIDLGDRVERRREQVLVVDVGADGRAVVTSRWDGPVEP